MKQLLSLSIAAMVVVALAVPVVTPGKGKAKHFQLVYQSDTRGWYRPCG